MNGELFGDITMHEYRARIMARGFNTQIIQSASALYKKAGLSGASFRKLHIKLIYLIFEEKFSFFQCCNMECIRRRAFKFGLDLSFQF